MKKDSNDLCAVTCYKKDLQRQHDEIVAALTARIEELEAALRVSVPREQYNEALFAAAEATGAKERLLGLLHHVDEEIVEAEKSVRVVRAYAPDNENRRIK